MSTDFAGYVTSSATTTQVVSTIESILNKKGSQVFTISGNSTVHEAALVMNEHKIGALVVTEGGRLRGMFTERDILQRVVGAQRTPAEIRVEEVMTTEVACARPHTTIEEARSVMKTRRIRHLPVVDEHHKLIGLISIGDLNAHHTSSQEMTIHLLEQYIYGQA